MSPGQDSLGRDRPVASATKTLAPIWSARRWSGRSPSQPTVLTVLTQTRRQFRIYADALDARAQFDGPKVGALA